ncbi:MAG: hypothetical protein ACD_74C00158G0002 [uncultured bacterium]|nr:MAG: hypothetical protein ACD_74C00158G0002 [uncultured bacterium]
MEDPKYRYALDEHGLGIDIFSLSDIDRKDYRCFGCGNIVRPVLPKTRKKHFRHKTQVACSPETYLHKIGKLLFEKNYRRCLDLHIPFLVEYPVPVVCNACTPTRECKIEGEFKTFDLTRVFEVVHVEKSDGALVPDLLLESKDGKQKIYIEIAVTHPCSQAKIDSGAKIIEIHLQSDEDLDILEQTSLSLRDGVVEFYNFRPLPIVKNNLDQCGKIIPCFVVFKGGNCHVGRYMPYEIKRFKKEGLYTREVDYASGQTFKEEVEVAFLKGVKVKNCFLCRYHAEGHWAPIFCKFLRRTTSSDFACDCQAYRPDPRVFKNKAG